MKRLCIWAAMLVFGLTTLASAAERELHAVGILQGREETRDQSHGPRATVLVDRPGSEVTLILASGHPVRWLVETYPGTTVEEIALVGRGSGRSEVRLDGADITDVARIASLPVFTRLSGPHFGRIVREAPTRFGFARLTGALAEYMPPEQGFVIDQALAEDDRLDPDYVSGSLSVLVDPPAAFRAFLGYGYAGHGETPEETVTFWPHGFEVARAGDVERIPVSGEVPAPTYAAGAAMDVAGDRLFGLSQGAGSGLYMYDRDADRWSILASFRVPERLVGMLYDPASDRLVMVMRRSIVLFDQDHGLQHVPFDVSRLPAIADVFNPGFEPEPPVYPRAMDGEQVLLEAVEYRFGSELTSRRSARGRVYVLDLGDGAVRMVGARN